MKYISVLSRFYASAWSILPEWHSTLENILLERARGERPDEAELEARLEGKSYGAKASTRPKEIAVLPLYGPIIDRADMFSEMSSVASHQGFAKMVRAAADDPDVSEIVIDADSPGGMVSSIDVPVEAMRYARSKKPVTVVCEGTLASAAYWIGSQADHIVASPTAQVGSIGVLMAHRDTTKLEQNLGVKTTILRTGPKKALGHPSETLSDEARAEIEREMGDIFGIFVGDVAEGRNRTPEAVEKEWGDGSVWIAGQALALGLIDEIGTLQSVLDGAANPKPRGGSKRAELPKMEGKKMDLDELKEKHPELYALVRKQGFDEGYEKGKGEAQAAESGSALEKKVVELSARLEASERQARDEKRRSIAVNALEAAKLPEFPKVEGRDLAASFRARVEKAALDAPSDDEAKTRVDNIVAEQKAIMGARKEEDPKPQRGAFLPTGDNSREEKPRAERTPTVSSARRSLGLS